MREEVKIASLGVSGKGGLSMFRVPPPPASPLPRSSLWTPPPLSEVLAGHSLGADRSREEGTQLWVLERGWGGER